MYKHHDQKLNVLSRMRNILNFEQRRITFKSFFESQKNANNKINRLHERALRLAYQNDLSNFQELLEKDNSFSIRNQNVLTLAIKIY